MKKAFIAALVGAIVVFIWQAVSHMALADVLHNSMNKTAPNADAIATAMAGAEDGMYMFPGKMEGESDQDAMKRMEGKPGGMIFYDASMDMNMARPMIVGFILDFLAVWIIVAMIGYGRERLNTFGKIWWATLLFGIFLVLMHHLMAWNWFGMPVDHTVQESIDVLITWALCG